MGPTHMRVSSRAIINQSELQAAGWLNAGLHRIAAVMRCRITSLPEMTKCAYPPNDRPRGDADLESVIYHIGVKDVSPVVVFQTQGQ